MTQLDGNFYHICSAPTTFSCIIIGSELLIAVPFKTCQAFFPFLFRLRSIPGRSFSSAILITRDAKLDLYHLRLHQVRVDKIYILRMLHARNRTLIHISQPCTLLILIMSSDVDHYSAGTIDIGKRLGKQCTP